MGKTSIGRSIAAIMGRKFHRIALGGIADQSDIRGHRHECFMVLQYCVVLIGVRTWHQCLGGS